MEWGSRKFYNVKQILRVLHELEIVNDYWWVPWKQKWALEEDE
jgi:hypothetical protein